MPSHLSFTFFSHSLLSLFLLLSFLSRITTRLWIQVAMNWIQSLSDQRLKCNQKRMTGLSSSPNVSCWGTRIPLSLLPSLTFSLSLEFVLSRKERDQGERIMKTTHEIIVTEKRRVGKRTSFKVNLLEKWSLYDSSSKVLLWVCRCVLSSHTLLLLISSLLPWKANSFLLLSSSLSPLSSSSFHLFYIKGR